jgi:hypothetical protein
MMDKNDFFREALKSFTYDSASGGAIEHLANLGYIPQEIEKMLDFPTPYRQVQETYWNYLVKKKILVEEKEDLSRGRKKEYFVTDHDACGRKSFRKVVEYEEDGMVQGNPDDFSEMQYHPGIHGKFSSFLQECCREGEAYVSCDFGLRMKREPEKYESFLQPLPEAGRRYIDGVPWKRKMVWHLLEERMMEILPALYGQSDYHGTILALSRREQIRF